MQALEHGRIILAIVVCLVAIRPFGCSSVFAVVGTATTFARPRGRQQVPCAKAA